MTPHQISADAASFKKIWSAEEIEQAKREIDQSLEFLADWEHAVRDMGLVYQEHEEYAGLFIDNGDFYVEEGVRIHAFPRTAAGEVILAGISDEDDSFLYYSLVY